MWKVKEVHRFHTGYNLWPWPLNSLMTLTLHVTRSNSKIAVSRGLLVWSELIGYWANCMTMPFDHTRDLDLGVSRSESEIALSQEWNGQLAWNKQDVSHTFMTIILTSVTMVGWADVHVFIYINTWTVSFAHFINDTSISRSTWMTLSSWEHRKWVLIWKFIPIKPNWYIIHSADYKDRYIFSFFNY